MVFVIRMEGRHSMANAGNLIKSVLEDDLVL